jgi:hypothetical protein
MLAAIVSYSRNFLQPLPQIEAADGAMSIDYLGQTFKGDLLSSGKIRAQCYKTSHIRNL